MKKIFYMMRHGQTLFNQRKKIQGWCDSPLTQQGIRQAEIAGEYFKEIQLDHLYSSTSERCCDTLEIVTQNRMPYTRLKGLKEMHFGTFEGESEDLNPSNERKETFFVQYGGESRDMVRQRLVSTCKDIMKQDNQQVLAVSHAGACLHFMREWVDEKRTQEELKKGFSNCCIVKYEYDTETEIFKFLEMIRPNFEMEMK